MHPFLKRPFQPPFRWPCRPRRHHLAIVGVVLLAACSTTPRQDRATTAGGERSGHLKLNGRGPASPPDGFPRFVDHSVGQEEISMQAMGLVGVPYRWGGNTPAAGFDCSGLVRYVVERAASINLPRTTADMSREGVSIAPDAVAPGDLIFFNTTGRAHSHVGVYVGDYRFVNAPSTGGTVRIDYVTNPYWAKRFDGIRRVAGRGTAPVIDSPILPPASPAIAPTRALAAVPDDDDGMARVTPQGLSPSLAQGMSRPGYVGTVIAPYVATPAPAAGPDPIATAITQAEAVDRPARGTGTGTSGVAASNGPADDDPIGRILTRGY